MRAFLTNKALPLVIFAAVAAVTACAGTQSYPTSHPEEVAGMPLCSECHTEWQKAYDHSNRFASSHRFYASRDQAVCQTCHLPSFCADCHADRDEIKPSDKFKDQPERTLPHRGDYLTRHKIDGKINPALCYKCHGRKNDRRCQECHR
jgi:hypothetical protein